MVYPDIIQNLNTESVQNKNKFHQASLPLRVLSFALDYFIFVPFVSFIILIAFSDGMRLYKSYPKSDEGQNLYALFILTFVFVLVFFQALFISFYKATPGQYFLKLKIQFENQDKPIFFQALIRQLGFLCSFAFLGIPFIQVLADRKGRCFYEKISDSEVISKSHFFTNYVEKSYFHSLQFELDRKYWNAGLSALYSFTIVVVLILVIQNYQEIITSPLTYKKLVQNAHVSESCQELKELSQLTSTERLRYLIAMNLAGTQEDHCLRFEADFVLWRNKTTDTALAYFAKSIITDNEKDQDNYLMQACFEKPDSEGCYWSKKYKGLSISSNNESYDKSFLGQMMQYQKLNPDQINERRDILKGLSQSSDLQTANLSFKKFMALENLDLLFANKNSDLPSKELDPVKRIPASKEEINSSDELIELKKIIKDL